KVPRPKKDYTPKPNGCGPDSWVSKLVPDQIYAVAKWHFSRACDAHDICYGTCNSDRAKCDKEFLADLRAWCQLSIVNQIIKKSWFERMREKREVAACYKVAKIYFNAVVRYGEKPHSMAQDDACECECPDPTTQPADGA